MKAAKKAAKIKIKEQEANKDNADEERELETTKMVEKATKKNNEERKNTKFRKKKERNIKKGRG